MELRHQVSLCFIVIERLLKLAVRLCRLLHRQVQRLVGVNRLLLDVESLVLHGSERVHGPLKTRTLHSLSVRRGEAGPSVTARRSSAARLRMGRLVRRHRWVCQHAAARLGARRTPVAGARRRQSRPTSPHTRPSEAGGSRQLAPPPPPAGLSADRRCRQGAGGRPALGSSTARRERWPDAELRWLAGGGGRQGLVSTGCPVNGTRAGPLANWADHLGSERRTFPVPRRCNGTQRIGCAGDMA